MDSVTRNRTALSGICLKAGITVLALAVFVASSPTIARADDDGGVRDNFRGDPPGTPLTLHEPNEDSVGGGWIQGVGADFQIAADGRSVRDAALNLPARIAVIDTQVTEYDLSVTIERAGPRTLTGVVVRYVDENNYLAATHDGRRLRLVRVVDGDETVLKGRSFVSRTGEPDLWRAEVRNESITVRVNERRRLSASDSTFADATLAGLIQQPSQDTVFRSFEVESNRDDDDEDDEDRSSATESPAPTEPVVQDSFTAPDGTALSPHTETEIVSGGGWSEVTGGWEIVGGKAILATPDPARPSGDHIAAIPSQGAPLQEISADITWNGGFAGLAWNVVAETAYSLVFWDGVSLVVGRVEGGAFHERGRRQASWTSGQSRNLRIELQDGHAAVYLDDSEAVLLALGVEAPTVLNAGLFDRFNAGNSFDNLVVRESSPGPEMPILVPDPPIGPPAPSAPPNDAWLYDSFNSADFSLLSHRTSEINPSGEGWTDVNGLWMLLDQQASEQSGVFGPLGIDRFAVIDTGTDEYELKSKVTWDGGRVGVFFSGRSNSPDDAGRNGFIFFRSGETLHVGRLIGGVYFPIASTERFSWRAGQTKTLRVEVEGDRARLKLGGRTIFRFSNATLEGSTWAGLFQRGGQDERYNDFTVKLP